MSILSKALIGAGIGAIWLPQVFKDSQQQSQETPGALPPAPLTLPQETLWQRHEQIHPYVQKHAQFTAQVANFLSNWIRQEKPTIYEIKAVMDTITPLLEFSKNLAVSAVQVAQPQAYERVNMMNNLIAPYSNAAPGVTPQIDPQTIIKNQALPMIYGFKPMPTEPQPKSTSTQPQQNPTQLQVPPDALELARKYQLLNQALK